MNTNDNSLRSRALLTTLNISLFVPKRIDRGATLETLIKHSASKDSGAFVKHLLPPEATKPVESAAGKLRNTYYSLTLPWADNVRILPTEMWDEFDTKMRELRGEFDAAVGQFLLDYAAHVQLAQVKLGSLYDSGEYPTVEEARARFGVKLNWFPISEASDFRVDLPEEALAQVRDDAASAATAGTDLMRQEMVDRLSKALLAVTEKLKDPDKVFRNSLISNLQEACQLLPKLNILGDEDILRHINAAEKIANIDPDHLRDNPEIRENTRQTAADVLAAMGIAA
jgi:hypothetical protein